MYNPYNAGQYYFNYGEAAKMDRLNYLQNSNPQIANSMYQPFSNNNQSVQPVINFDCKPVTSIDEAKAYSVRLDGNPSYMVDVNAKSIYEKKLDMNTGAANFKTYKLVEDVGNVDTNQPILNNDSSVSKEDFLKLDEKVSELSQKQDDILLNLKNLIMKRRCCK